MGAVMHNDRPVGFPVKFDTAVIGPITCDRPFGAVGHHVIMDRAMDLLDKKLLKMLSKSAECRIQYKLSGGLLGIVTVHRVSFLKSCPFNYLKIYQIFIFNKPLK